MSREPRQPETLPHAAAYKWSGRAAGAVGGLAIANKYFPPEVHAGNVDFEARLTLEHGATGHWGTIGLHAPNALSNLPVGLDGTITNLPIKANGSDNTFKSVTEAVHQLPHMTGDIAFALAKHLVPGAIIGSLIGGALVYAAGKRLHQPDIVDRAKAIAARIGNLGRVKKAAALGSMALAMTGCAGAAAVNVIQPEHETRAYLSDGLVGDTPALKGAYVTGVDPATFEQAESDFEYVNESYKEEGHTSSRVETAIANFRDEYQKAYKEYIKQYALDPDNIIVEQVGDAHCYPPNLPLEQAIITEFGPDIIADSGDWQTNEGEAPWEGRCVSDQIDIYKAVAAANRKLVYAFHVNGNHDEHVAVNYSNVSTTGKEGVIVQTLRGGHSGEALGATFVGADDPRNTIYSTVPSPTDKVATRRALAKQGSVVAKAACAITSTTGEAPFLITHAKQLSEEALYKGCGKIAFNGHTHHNGEVNVITGLSGLQEYQHTVGSATGVTDGGSIYLPQHEVVSSTTWYINRYTHEPAAVVTANIYPDGKAEIINQKLDGDGTSTNNEYIHDLSYYSPTATEMPPLISSGAQQAHP
jgi:hypothetical protein